MSRGLWWCQSQRTLKSRGIPSRKGLCVLRSRKLILSDQSGVRETFEIVTIVYNKTNCTELLYSYAEKNFAGYQLIPTNP